MANPNGLPDIFKPLTDLTQQLNVGVKSLVDGITKPLGLPELPGLPALPGIAGNPGNPGKGNPGNSALALPGLPDLTKAITSVEDVLIPAGMPRPSAILTAPAAKPAAPAARPAARPAPEPLGPSLLTESKVPGVKTTPGVYYFK